MQFSCKVNIFISLCIFTSIYTFSETNAYIQGEIQTSPWFYESVYEIHGIGVSTSWNGGIQYDFFTLGLDLFSDYVSLNGGKDENLLKGSWFNIGCNLLTKYKAISWIEFALSAGFIWNQSAFDINDSGWLGRGLPGIEMKCASLFTLSSSLRLELLSKLDLLFSENILINNLNFKVGTRIYLNPGIDWINLYGELNAFYWQYRSEIIPDGVLSWMFKAEIGVFLNLFKKPVNILVNNTVLEEEMITSVDDSIEIIDQIENTDKEENENEKQFKDPGLQILSDARVGDKIRFYTILFDDEELTEESISVLDGIARILFKNNSLVISIFGYTELLMDPRRELELCKIRATKMKEYLISRGVKDTQVRQNPIGNIITDKKPYIQIEIIENNMENDNN